MESHLDIPWKVAALVVIAALASGTRLLRAATKFVWAIKEMLWAEAQYKKT